MICPHCKKLVPPAQLAKELGSKGGAIKSSIKTKAARINGSKGGRPKDGKQ